MVDIWTAVVSWEKFVRPSTWTHFEARGLYWRRTEFTVLFRSFLPGKKVKVGFVENFENVNGLWEICFPLEMDSKIEVSSLQRAQKNWRTVFFGYFLALWMKSEPPRTELRFAKVGFAL